MMFDGVLNTPLYCVNIFVGISNAASYLKSIKGNSIRIEKTLKSEKINWNYWKKISTIINFSRK